MGAGTILGLGSGVRMQKNQGGFGQILSELDSSVQN